MCGLLYIIGLPPLNIVNEAEKISTRQKTMAIGSINPASDGHSCRMVQITSPAGAMIALSLSEFAVDYRNLLFEVGDIVFQTLHAALHVLEHRTGIL